MGVTAVANSTSQTTVTWMQIPGAQSYNVRRNSVLFGNVSALMFVDMGLSPATSYAYTISAVVGGVEGTLSAPASATTQAPAVTAPGAPTGVTITSAGLVSWTAPADGGSNIISYTIKIGATTQTSNSSPYAVTGLVAGTTYSAQVAATNVIGTGSYSTASPAVEYVTVPGAPTNVTALAGDGQISVSCTAPASNGGANIQSYTYITSDGAHSATVTGGTAVINGLANGQTYQVYAYCTNIAGNSANSAFSPSVTPATGSKALTITTTSPLITATVGQPYADTFVASGGTSPYTWAFSALPSWVTTSGATISGTPNASGTATITAKVTDSSGTQGTAATAPTLRTHVENLGANPGNTEYIGSTQTGKTLHDLLVTTITANAGDDIYFFDTSSMYGGNALHTSYTVVDSAGATFSILQNLNVLTQNVNNTQQTVLWAAQNVAAGSHALTQRFDGYDNDYQSGYAIAISNSAGLVGSAATNANNGTIAKQSTNSITSGNITVAAADCPALLVGFAFNLSQAGLPYTPTPGSNMTAYDTTWAFFESGGDNVCIATRAITTAGTYAAVFNNPSNAPEYVQCLAFIVKGTPGSAGSSGAIATGQFALPVNAAVSGNLVMYSNGVLSSQWNKSYDYSYGNVTPPTNYNYTTNPQQGHTQSLAVFGNCGWQQASPWDQGPNYGIDISGYTQLQFDVYVPKAGDTIQSLAHYTREAGDDIAVSTYLNDIQTSCGTITAGIWQTKVIRLAHLGMLGSTAYYKFLLQSNGNFTAQYDNIEFVPGNTSFLYNASALVSGWTATVAGGTINTSFSPNSVSNNLFALNQPPLGQTVAAQKIMALTTIAANPTVTFTFSAGFALAKYTRFTLGLLPTKAGYGYTVQFLNTSGVLIGSAVTLSGQTPADFGVNTANFTVYEFFLTLAGSIGTTIGGVRLTETSSNTTNLFYITAPAFTS